MNVNAECFDDNVISISIKKNDFGKRGNPERFQYFYCGHE